MSEEDDLVEPEGLNAGSTEPATAGDAPAGGEREGPDGAAMFEGQDPGVSGAKATSGPGQELSAGEG